MRVSLGGNSSSDTHVTIHHVEAPPDAPQETPYFAVGIFKLATLSIASFGLYLLFWFYQHWRCEYTRTGESLNPVARAFFSPIFAYSLFSRVKAQLTSEEQEDLASPAFLATAYFLLIVAGRLPDPYWLLAFLAFLPLLPVQIAINRLNQRCAPGAPLNDRFTKANIALIVLGAFVLGLMLLGLFVQEVPASDSSSLVVAT